MPRTNNPFANFGGGFKGPIIPGGGFNPVKPAKPAEPVPRMSPGTGIGNPIVGFNQPSPRVSPTTPGGSTNDQGGKILGNIPPPPPPQQGKNLGYQPPPPPSKGGFMGSPASPFAPIGNVPQGPNLSNLENILGQILAGQSAAQQPAWRPFGGSYFNPMQIGGFGGPFMGMGNMGFGYQNPFYNPYY